MAQAITLRALGAENPNFDTASVVGGSFRSCLALRVGLHEVRLELSTNCRCWITNPAELGLVGWARNFHQAFFYGDDGTDRNVCPTYTAWTSGYLLAAAGIDAGAIRSRILVTTGINAGGS
jgi:hypothetical protein